MTATLKWIAGDIESMIPSWSFSSTVQKAPELGDTAPASALHLPEREGTVLLFTRHMGCPFCEKGGRQYGQFRSLYVLNATARLLEIKNLVALAKDPGNSEICFIVITHSVPTYELQKFVTEELEQKLPQNVTLFGDAERRVYAAWGLGELSLLEIINKDIMTQVGELKKQGIANRLTRGTRWQTNGAFSLDKEGKIRYRHVGANSGDTADLEQAVKSVS